MEKHRVEKDSLGEKKIGIDVLYGIQTLRASENFEISNLKIKDFDEIIWSYTMIKKSCAIVNYNAGKLEKFKFIAIIEACDEILDGQHRSNFIVDIFQAGAGTSTNMNINEVITNRALEIIGEEKGNYKIISPNDDVNMAQSTNDTYPTMMRLAISKKIKEKIKYGYLLADFLGEKSMEFKSVLKSARTHLQDAVPITLGAEFKSFSSMIKKNCEKMEQAMVEIKYLGIGGTAAGTGICADKDFGERSVKEISKQTGMDFFEAEDKIESMISQKEILFFSSVLKNFAIEVSKISSDLRLLSSGPNTGFNEIDLPAVQPGSSIMPGKINPSILECVNMVCFRVIASERVVADSMHQSELNLNVFMPVMLSEVLDSVEIFFNSLKIFAEKCVKNITANPDICKNYALKSAGLATALNTKLGYAKVAELVKESLKEGVSVKEILKKEGVMSDKEIDDILSVESLSS